MFVTRINKGISHYGLIRKDDERLLAAQFDESLIAEPSNHGVVVVQHTAVLFHQWGECPLHLIHYKWETTGEPISHTCVLAQLDTVSHDKSIREIQLYCYIIRSSFTDIVCGNTLQS